MNYDLIIFIINMLVGMALGKLIIYLVGQHENN